MKKTLRLIISILCIGMLASCDEALDPSNSIVPASASKLATQSSVQQTLQNSFWQYSEINISAGAKSKMVFSRQQSIGLNNTISKMQINFKKDGTITAIQQGLVTQKGKWRLLNSDKQLELAIENHPIELYNIVSFNKDVIEYQAVLSKNSTNEDVWSMNLAFLGASDANTKEIITTYKLNPI